MLWRLPAAVAETTTDRVQAYLQNVLGSHQSDLEVEEVRAKFAADTGRLRVQATISLPTVDVAQDRIEQWLTEVLEQDRSELRPSVLTVEVLPVVS
jgi:hypothetical protein